MKMKAKRKKGIKDESEKDEEKKEEGAWEEERIRRREGEDGRSR